MNVSVETPFELKVGQTASIEGHEFTFSQVRSDSRCPKDAQCIWAGEVTIVLTPQDEPGLTFSPVYLSTNSSDISYLFPDNTNSTICSREGTCTTSSNPYTYGYGIGLISVSPQPEVGKEIDPSNYTATLVIYLSA